jgi:hypothetical protein
MASSARFVEMFASSEAQDGKGYASLAEKDVLISNMSSVMMYGHWVYMKLLFSAGMYLEDMFLYDDMLVPRGLRIGKQRVASRESRFVVHAAERKVEVIESLHLEAARGSTSLLLVSITPTSSYLGFSYSWYDKGGFREASGLGHPLVAIPPLLL